MLLHNLSYFKDLVQDQLFPYLREKLGNFNEFHQKVAAVLALTEPENFVPRCFRPKGRPVKDRGKIARAFVAKATLNISNTKEILDRLKYDHSLRIICGWDYPHSIPSEATFSRSFREFSNSELPEQIHQALVRVSYKDSIICHSSRDATDIPAREKSKRPKSKEATKRSSRGGPPGGSRSKTAKQKNSGLGWKELFNDIPKECDSGSKVSSKRTRMYWMGYKLHADVSDDGIPLSCLLSSASCSDTMLAIPLSQKTDERVTVLYELMDRAYDATAVREFITDSGRVPVIQKKPRNQIMKQEMAQESMAQKLLNFRPIPDYRLSKRTVVERFFSDLKDNYAGRFFRYRTHAKVFCHMMFSVVALTATKIINKLC